MRVLRVLRRLIVIDVTRTLIYRGEFVVYMLGIVVGPAVALLVWRAAAASGAALPVTMEYLVSYFVLLGVVNMLVSSWLAWWLAEMIRLGQLSTWLVRPASVFIMLLANNLSEKLVKAVILAPMVGVLGWVFRDQLRLPAAPGLWALFGLSVVLAATITFAVDVVLGALAFWFDDIGGFFRLRLIAGAVLSGQMVPLALFPEWTAGFIAVQPFRFMLSFPLELLVGGLSASEVAMGMVLQVGYTVAAVGGAVLIWRRGQRVYAAVGA
ncbi:MAG: ABC-2 family transporter protein [Chloroflexia bacterium]|nr:ABC-2 family transporter protein [Chloroflexia bacterium]